MLVEIDLVTDPQRARELDNRLTSVLGDVREVVEDAEKMAQTACSLAETLEQHPPKLPSTDEVTEGARLLRWLADGHFTFLGYRKYELVDSPQPDSDEPALRAVLASGLGVLRQDSLAARSLTAGPDSSVDALAPSLLVLTQASAPSTVHRPVYPYYVGVKTFDENGKVTGEHRFLGMFTTTALHENVLDIPVVGQRVREVIHRAGFPMESFSGQRMLEVLQNWPRADLFSADTDSLFYTTTGAITLSDRRRLRLFLRRDPYGRFYSCLVYLPRDRYTTRSRLAMQEVLLEELEGTQLEYSARVGETLLAQVHFMVHTDPSNAVEPDTLRIQERLNTVVRSWDDRLVEAIIAERRERVGDGGPIGMMGEESVVDRGQRFGAVFPEAYKEDFTAEDALADLAKLDTLADEGDLALSFYLPADAEPGERRFKLYLRGEGVTLSKVLPVLQAMGVEVVDERPYELFREDGGASWIYDFGLRVDKKGLEEADEAAAVEVRERFQDAFHAAWHGDAEVDGLNGLVLRAGLTWRQAAVLRAYSRYLQQARSPFSQSYIQNTVVKHTEVATKLVRLFETRCDPQLSDVDRKTHAESLTAEISSMVDEVTSLDEDRILRRLLAVINATLRTNYHVRDADGNPRPYLALKLDPSGVPELPEPHPKYEIFVYSPRVEGVHLRFGEVARGGLRWSDRREDFRTEILGLVKAQAVKNAVIVPVGAKGGFVVKRPPTLHRRRRGRPRRPAHRRHFLLPDVHLRPAGPHRQPRRGRNRARAERGAPRRRRQLPGRRGGQGHREVLRHRQRSLGAVRLLARRRVRLRRFGRLRPQGHGHHRQGRLGEREAALPRAGQGHPDRGLHRRRHRRHDGRRLRQRHAAVRAHPAGRGVQPHARLPRPEPGRRVVVRGTAAAVRPAAQLVGRLRPFADQRGRRDLPALGQDHPDHPAGPRGARPRRGRHEARADGPDPGDPAGPGRTAVERRHRHLRQGRERKPGRGGRQGQRRDPRQRQPAAREGRRRGRQPGPDPARPHRIRPHAAARSTPTRSTTPRASTAPTTRSTSRSCWITWWPSGELEHARRNELLGEMTDEVGSLVLADNYRQNAVLGVSRAHAGPMVSVHARQVSALVAKGAFDRKLEALPTPSQFRALEKAGEGLTSPELATLLAHVKLDLKDELLASDLPESEVFTRRLPEYFPAPLRERFAAAIAQHPLRRQIITTLITNELVDGGGISFVYRLMEEMNATATDAVRAYAVVTHVYDLPKLWAEIDALDNVVPTAVADRMVLETRLLLDRAARWFLTNRPQPLAPLAEINRFGPVLAELGPKLGELLRGRELESVEQDAAGMVEEGVPAELARQVALLLHSYGLLDVVEVAELAEQQVGLDATHTPADTAELYYALSDHLDIDKMLTEISALERGNRWHALARLSLRDDVYGSLRAIALDALRHSDQDLSVDEQIEQWEKANASRLSRARVALDEITRSGRLDLATLSVAARQIRSTVR